ncbi:hypothetical protein BH11ARM2_BH11ARM2_18320 [soil metagenome]
MPYDAPPKTELNLYVSRNVAPSDKIQLQLSSKNVPRATLTLAPIDPFSWASALGTVRENTRPKTVAAPISTWTASVASKGQKQNPNQADTYYSRQTNLPKAKPGVYLVTLTGGGKTAWAVVNITRLRVAVKRSSSRLTAWITMLGDGPLAGARLTAFNPGGTDPKEGKSGNDGLWTLPLKPGARTLLVRGPGGDVAAISTGAEDPDGKLKGHIQLDRPIYRPGQRILYRVLMRRTLGQGYSLPKDANAVVELRDARDNPIDRFTRPISEFGAVEGGFDLPREAMTGAYTLVVILGKDRIYQTLSVAAYRKPEFKATLAPSARLLAGDEAKIPVTAETYFGTPVPGAEVRFQVRRHPRPFFMADEEGRWFASGDGNLYPSDTYGGADYAGGGSVQTDAAGHATITFPTDPARGDSVYEVTATVIDATRRQVEASTSISVDAADIRVGIAAEQGYVNLGELAAVRVMTVGGDGKPRAAEAHLTLIAHDWDEKLGRTKDRVVTETTVKVPASGKATAKIAAREAGSLTIHVEVPDGKGRSAKADASLYVAGNFGEKDKPEKEPARIDVRLPHARFAAGETAEALITTNRPGAPMILTLEGRDLFQVKVVPHAPRNFSWRVPVDEKLGPTAVVSAAIWDGVSYVSGGQTLQVPLASKALQVAIEMDKAEYEAGDVAHLVLTTRDAKGKPVAAEAGVAVVDSSIFALAPDATSSLGGTYWGPRPNQVALFVSAPEEVSGGAYQRVSSGVAPVRRRFEDTAYWNGAYQTGALGSAEATFEVPGNLTTWRAVALATTKETAVGQALTTFLARRPVTLRLALPRHFTVGDRVEVSGTVDNRTDQDRGFKVTLEGYEARSIRVAAHTSGKVTWEVPAPQRGQVVLSAMLQDSTGDPKLTDRLEQTVPVGGGLVVKAADGGTMGREVTATIPTAKEIDPSTRTVKIEVTAGAAGAARAAVGRVMAGGLYSVPQAADMLRLATDPKDVREALAVISRTAQPTGWGWFENAPPDGVITARVLSALTARRNALLGNQLETAKAAALARYDGDGLWERRALLAAALVDAEAKEGKDRIEDVLKRGLDLSPFARLKMALALLKLGDTARARALYDAVIHDATIGDTSAFIPVGEGAGWAATDAGTTAMGLQTAVALKDSLAPKLARYAAQEAEGEDAEVAVALNGYAQGKPESRVGSVVAIYEGKEIPLVSSRVDGSASGEFPAPGSDTLTLRRNETGEAFYRIESKGEVGVWPHNQKISVLRRLEVLNGAGLWIVLNRPIKPGEAVRVTLVVWGDGAPDAVRVSSPIPAGFEVADAEEIGDGRTDTRDDAVVWYLPNAESPRTLRVILRAEATGTVSLVPAEATYLRRTGVLGATDGMEIRVEK